MKAKLIVKKLMENLPKHVDDYNIDVSSVFNPESISISGYTVTVTKTDHGLVQDELISVVNSKLVNSVDSISIDSDLNATITTDNEHDLTEDYQTQVTLKSASEPSIDGVYTLISVPSSLTFVVSNFTFSDPIPTDVKLVENRSVSINGLFAANYIDDDNFSYESEYTFDSGLEIDPTSVDVFNQMRISRGADIKRLIKHYNSSPPTELNLQVVLGGTSINKDQSAYTDADMEQGGSNEWNGYLLSPFNVYCFDTLGNDSTGGDAKDRMVDLRMALFKSLLGEEIATNTVAGVNDAVYPIGDDTYQYDVGYYIHEFQFSQQIMISLGDTAKSDTVSRAVNSVEFDIEKIDGKNILISGKAETRN